MLTPEPEHPVAATITLVITGVLCLCVVGLILFMFTRLGPAEAESAPVTRDTSSLIHDVLPPLPETAPGRRTESDCLVPFKNHVTGRYVNEGFSLAPGCSMPEDGVDVRTTPHSFVPVQPNINTQAPTLVDTSAFARLGSIPMESRRAANYKLIC